MPVRFDPNRARSIALAALGASLAAQAPDRDPVRQRAAEAGAAPAPTLFGLFDELARQGPRIDDYVACPDLNPRGGTLSPRARRMLADTLQQARLELTRALEAHRREVYDAVVERTDPLRMQTEWRALVANRLTTWQPMDEALCDLVVADYERTLREGGLPEHLMERLRKRVAKPEREIAKAMEVFAEQVDFAIQAFPDDGGFHWMPASSLPAGPMVCAELRRAFDRFVTRCVTWFELEGALTDEEVAAVLALTYAQAEAQHVRRLVEVQKSRPPSPSGAPQEKSTTTGG